MCLDHKSQSKNNITIYPIKTDELTKKPHFTPYHSKGNIVFINNSYTRREQFCGRISITLLKYIDKYGIDFTDQDEDEQGINILTLK